MSNITQIDSDTFVESGCKATVNGVEYEHNGAYITKSPKNGKFNGMLYAYPSEHRVGTWDGSIKLVAHFANIWKSNFGDLRQTVYFLWENRQCQGVYFKNSDLVRFKEISGK